LDKKSKPADDAKKAQRAEDGRKAMAEYEAAAEALRVKTERLRALRLARDAAEAADPKPPAPAKRTTAKGGKSKSAKATPLSSWLQDRDDSGHHR
jgi:hypothetical protein